MTLLLAEPKASLPFPTLDVLVDRAARHFGVEAQALMVRTRQHLPRLNADLGPDLRAARREVDSCASRLVRDLHRAAGHLPDSRFPLAALRFAEIDEAAAQPILTSLHHLGGARAGSRCFALLDPVQQRPVALCSLSDLQWPALERRLSERFELPSGGTMVDLSRVLAVPGAPADAVPTLLARVREVLRRGEPAVTLLTSVVDPNLGLDASELRAAGWQQWMRIQARPYAYHNLRFVTPLQLRERFGTSDVGALRARSTAFQESRGRLLDQLLLCCRVHGATEPVRPQDMARLRR